MSSTGSTGGASRTHRIDVTTPAAGDGDGTAPAGTTPSTVTRTPASTGRHSVATAVTASGSFAAIGGAGTAGGARAASVPGAAIELPEAAAAILTDGTIAPRGASASEGPLAALNALALARAGDAGAFDRVSDKALLSRVADKLVATHAGLTGAAPDDATTLAWRQSRAASLALIEEAAVRAAALGDKALAKAILGKLAGAVQAEPWRQIRDFAFESLVSRAESKALPEVAAARAALYPEAPPYETWLADGKISILLTCDDNGSKIADNVDLYRSLGFKDKLAADGSHVLTLTKRGKPPIEVTIPPRPQGGGEPALFDRMDDPRFDVIAYGGHAGHGQRIEHALAQGVKGTGADKAVILMQCTGQGNVESLERTFPDAAVISTTELTSDNYDFELMTRVIEGFQAKSGWEEIRKKTVSDLKRNWKDDIKNGELNPEGHFFFPTTRSVLVERYDRDGDGKSDQLDHIFNVVYPKRVDAAGGYDPVVQPVPRYALDGTALNQALNQLSLVVRYDHLLPEAQERKLPWDPAKWKSGAFFEPAAGDLRAFQFAKEADGAVSVALSSRFAHTQKQDLSRMLGVEAGLWLGAEAGLSGAERTAMGVGVLQRIVEAQGAWAQTGGGFLDEPWADEQLLMKRYGLEGFTFGALNHLVGEPDDYKPEHFSKVAALVRGLPGAAAAGDRAPTAVGAEIPVRGEVRLSSPGSSISKDTVTAALRALGVDGDVTAFSPGWLAQNQPTNVSVIVSRAGEARVVSLGVDDKGFVRIAANLGIDVHRKADLTLHASLEQICAGVPEERRGRARADAFAAYDRARAGGKTPAEAFSEAIRAVRIQLPPGTPPTGIATAYHLEQMGLMPPASISSSVSLYMGDTGTARVERALFDWVRAVAARDPRIDVGRVEAAYLREVASPRPGEGGAPAARLRGLEAVLAALPQDCGAPVSAESFAFAGGGWISMVPAPERDRILSALRTRMKVTDLDTRSEAVFLHMDALLDAVPADRRAAARGAGRAAYDGARASGKTFPEAFEAALRALRPSIPLGTYGSIGGVFSSDEFTPAEREAAEGVSRLFFTADEGHAVERYLFAWLRRLGARDPSIKVDKLSSDFARELATARSETGGSQGAWVRACDALLAALPADCGPPVSVDEGLFDVGWSDPVGDANASRIRTAFRSRTKFQ